MVAGAVDPQIPIIQFEHGSWVVFQASPRALELLAASDVSQLGDRLRAMLLPEVQHLLITRVAVAGGALRFQIPGPGPTALDAWAQGNPSGWSLTLMPRLVEMVVHPTRAPSISRDVLLTMIPVPACVVTGMGHIYAENPAWSTIPVCQRNPAVPVSCSPTCLELSGCGLTQGGPVPEARRFLRAKPPASGSTDIQLGRCGDWRVIDGRAVGQPTIMAFERGNEHGGQLATKARQELSMMAESLQSIREEERQAVARELHDGLGQELAVLNMLSFGLKQAIQNERDQVRLASAVFDFLSRLDQQSRRISESSRNVAMGLRSEALVQKGLVASCTELIERAMHQHQRVCSFQVLPLWVEPEIALSLNIYRCLQECLSNIQRHAQATKVKVILGGYEGGYMLEVRDNGMGFGPRQGQELDAKHIGLRSMRERVKMFDGELSIRTRPEVDGSIVRVFFRERRKMKRGTVPASIGFFDRLALTRAHAVSVPQAAGHGRDNVDDKELSNCG